MSAMSTILALADRPAETIPVVPSQTVPLWEDGEWFSLGPALRRYPLHVRLYMVAADPSRFRAWLRSLDQGARVGRALDETDCPLVHWLRAEQVFGRRPFMVWPKSVVLQRWPILPLAISPIMLSLPRWAQEFVDVVDRDERDCVLRHEALRDLSVAERRARAVHRSRGLVTTGGVR